MLTYDEPGVIVAQSWLETLIQQIAFMRRTWELDAELDALTAQMLADAGALLPISVWE